MKRSKINRSMFCLLTFLVTHMTNPTPAESSENHRDRRRALVRAARVYWAMLTVLAIERVAWLLQQLLH
jgi:hypothetical protein